MTAKTAPFKFKLYPIAGNAYESKDAAGNTCIVVTLASMGAAGRGYQGLELRFSPGCTVRLGGKEATNDAAILVCRDPTYAPQFDALRAVLKEQLLTDPTLLETSDAVAGFVDTFAKAFQKVRQPLDRELELGLWGELQILKLLSKLDRAVDAWQGPQRYLVDFSRNNVDIEVKTSARGHLHRIKHAQTLAPPAPETTRIYASVVVAADPAGGTGLAELVEQTRKDVHNKLAFDAKLAAYGYEPAPVTPYSGLWTLKAVKFVAQPDLPALPDFPPEVIEVDYTLDLTDIAGLPTSKQKSLLSKIVA